MIGQAYGSWGRFFDLKVQSVALHSQSGDPLLYSTRRAISKLKTSDKRKF